MKTQIFLVTALFAGLASVNANAIAMNRSYAYCTQGGMADAGLVVTVTEHEVGLLPSIKISYTADVAEETLHGGVNTQTFDVVRKQSAAIGAPQVFTGKGFKLSINVDAAPVSGQIAGTLDVLTDSLEASVPVLCTLN